MYYVALKLRLAGPLPPYVTLFCNINLMVVTLNSLSPPKTIENKNLKHVFFALKHCLKTFFFKTKFNLIGVYWVPKACIGCQRHVLGGGAYARSLFKRRGSARSLNILVLKHEKFDFFLLFIFIYFFE
jgi:hypothetical protein